MDQVKDWLMEGDPAIRWQTMRDLSHAPKAKWQAERKKVASEGWGARFLSYQAKNGIWGGGLYSPKWVSSTYTLLQLRDLGLPRENPAAQRGTEIVLDGMLGKAGTPEFSRQLADMDLCIVGMMLALAVYFQIQDSRTAQMVTHLLDHQLGDCGWNCRVRRMMVKHSSFHTTFNVLDGVREYIENGPRKQRAELVQAEGRAFELMFEHQLFRSDKTGKIIHPHFTDMAYPFRWHYDFMRALDLMQRANAPCDPRLKEAIALLESKRLPDGTWKNEYMYSGKTFFNMESVGKPSRWNTLRALRVLNWWKQAN